VSLNQLVQKFEAAYLVKKRPEFKVGDTVKVHLRIIEGEKERIQVFTGLVIARKGKGVSETFSVYRNAYGCSMERVFLLNSTRIAKIEVVRSGKTRKSKLYYIRGETGKKAKLKEKVGLLFVENPAEVISENVEPIMENALLNETASVSEVKEEKTEIAKEKKKSEKKSKKTKEE
jgi:large subunit ribosomal protein L19